jgi:hypothetical protein
MERCDLGKWQKTKDKVNGGQSLRILKKGEDSEVERIDPHVEVFMASCLSTLLQFKSHLLASKVGAAPSEGLSSPRCDDCCTFEGVDAVDAASQTPSPDLHFC